MTDPQDRGMEDEETVRNSLFRYDDPIFKNESLLQVSHLPDPDRIVGRDEEMQEVAEALNPALFGNEPIHLFIYGKTGTGKTLISRSVTQMLQEEAAEWEGTVVDYAVADCGTQNTEASVVMRLAQALNDPDKTGFTVPARGLSTGDYYDRLWTAIDTCTDVSIIILDEVDLLENDEVLRKLSRAGENQWVTNARIGIIAISNKIDYPDELSERVQSSFNRDEVVTHPYDANDLTDILEKRQDAFRDGVLSNDAIPLTAALAAQEHGDARKAINILRNAGRIAKKQNDDQVTEEHVRAAKQKTEVDRFAELIAGSPIQTKTVLYALTLLTEQSSDDEFRTRRVYQAYQNIANELGNNILSERRIREILQEQDFLNVIESERRGQGRGQGMTSMHRLLEDPEIVQTVLLRDSQLDEL